MQFVSPYDPYGIHVSTDQYAIHLYIEPARAIASC